MPRFMFWRRLTFASQNRTIMKTKIVSIASKAFILLSALSFLSVSIMAFMNPQSVMDLVQVKLENNDAYSSIRGVYGGVGLSIVIALVYAVRKDHRKGLAFLAILWGLYALSRLITSMTEGQLGEFGTQWMIIETVFCTISIALLALGRKNTQAS